MGKRGFTTCLWFDGQAEAAAEYYVSIFPDSTLGNVSHYTEAGPGEPESVIAAEFEINGQEFVALNGGSQLTFSEGISFQVFCDDQEEVDYYWEKLTAGGGEQGRCGWLKDRYGVSWQVIPTALGAMLGDPDPAKAARTTQAMLQMRKLDIARLEQAHSGG